MVKDTCTVCISNQLKMQCAIKHCKVKYVKEPHESTNKCKNILFVEDIIHGALLYAHHCLKMRRGEKNYK